MTVKYFAYGSNMSPERMANRKCTIFSAKKGILLNYKIVFNKRSKTLINTGFANIEESIGDHVEGILYEIDSDSLMQLDKVEGCPRHYIRVQKPIITEANAELAEIYIAAEKWISEGLKPSKEYLTHLLEAKDYLSDAYFNRLKSILTIDI